jgi:hypothetical protein
MARPKGSLTSPGFAVQAWISRQLWINRERTVTKMKPLVLFLSYLLLATSACALSFPNFVQCVSAKGQGALCQLDAGTFPVSETILIGRSNITIAGTLDNLSRATTLQRAPGFKGALLKDEEAAGATLKSIEVRDLTIDGNRAKNTLSYSSYSPEASIFAISHLTFSDCAFNNSPSIGLGLYGAGTSDVLVNGCTFSNPVVYGLWSDATGDNSNITYKQCAAKRFVENVIVENSLFENAGEPAILGEMINVQILDNIFTNNHSNAVPFDDDGGQIDLTVCTQNAVIWNNTFENGPENPNGRLAGGIELHGTNIAVINNIVKNNKGGGIGLDGTQHVFIADWASGSGNFDNGESGIAIGHSSSTFRQTEWVTVDSAYATSNTQYGIWSDTSNTTPTEPVNHLTILNTCLAGNDLGPTYLKNLGSDVTLKNNLTTGCAVP